MQSLQSGWVGLQVLLLGEGALVAKRMTFTEAWNENESVVFRERKS